jgi:hypothetical protein
MEDFLPGESVDYLVNLTSDFCLIVFFCLRMHTYKHALYILKVKQSAVVNGTATGQAWNPSVEVGLFSFFMSK